MIMTNNISYNLNSFHRIFSQIHTTKTFSVANFFLYLTKQNHYYVNIDYTYYEFKTRVVSVQ